VSKHVQAQICHTKRVFVDYLQPTATSKQYCHWDNEQQSTAASQLRLPCHMATCTDSHSFKHLVIQKTGQTRARGQRAVCSSLGACVLDNERDCSGCIMPVCALCHLCLHTCHAHMSCIHVTLVMHMDKCCEVCDRNSSADKQTLAQRFRKHHIQHLRGLYSICRGIFSIWGVAALQNCCEHIRCISLIGYIG